MPQLDEAEEIESETYCYDNMYLVCFNMYLPLSDLDPQFLTPIFEATDITVLVGVLAVLSTALKLGFVLLLKLKKKGNTGEKAITLLLNLVKLFLPQKHCFPTTAYKFFKVNSLYIYCNF